MRNNASTQTFATPAAVAAVLDLPAGRIQVIAADRADTTVEIRPAVAGRNRDEQAAQRITVSFADGVLRVEAAPQQNPLLGSSGYAEVTVQLPAGSQVEARVPMTEFRGVGRLGAVTVEGASGSIKLDEAATARLALQSGDVLVGRLAGGGQLSTQKGELRVDEAVAGAVELTSGHGGITVGVSRQAAATLDAGTSFGRVVNEIRDTGGAAELSIRATTAHGDITARSL